MRLRTQLFLGFLLVFTLMIVIAVVSYNGFQADSESARSVAHTHEVIGETHKLEKLLSDMETGQRGFLLTGEDEFLEPYDLGREEYKRTISKVLELVSDKPAQVHRFEKVEMLVEKWQTVAAEPEIGLYGLLRAGYQERA